MIAHDEEAHILDAELRPLLEALRAVLFQAAQGKVFERDACITQARAALARAEGRA